MSAFNLISLAREGLQAAVDAVRTIQAQLAGCPSDQLGQLMQELAAVEAAAVAARVRVLAEAVERGVVAQSDQTGPADWAAAHSGPGAQVTEAVPLARVAAQCGRPELAPVTDAVAAGRCSLRLAASVAAEYDRLRALLDESMHADVLAGLVHLATSGHSPRDLSQFRDHLIGQYGQVGELDRRQARCHARRAMSAFASDLEGMYHAVVVLDPASHAQVLPILEALSAPVTHTDPAGDPVRDSRSADQRRADAFVEICTLAAESVSHQPDHGRRRVGGRARLVVTMDLDQLQARLGCGTTEHGQVLAPATVRRLACDADLIPAVLGSGSEVLDLGRRHRLATPALVMALWQRDQGCTFPGCSRPPGWCRAHHVRHWVDGGATALDNLALLCERHHTVVHQRGYQATVSPTGVTWHLYGHSCSGAAPPGRPVREASSAHPGQGSPPEHQASQPPALPLARPAASSPPRRPASAPTPVARSA